MEIKLCQIEGCDRKARNKGFYKGKTRYGNTCEYHHKNKEKLDNFFRKNIENKSCEVCGWDKAPCDRHRLDPSLGYVKENVKILCPNCHRLFHAGLIYV